jgi:ribose 1,5-bisphosphokinase
MSGCWVIVCGPSGAGKDSVLAWAREALAQHPGVCFADRLVTRASQAGSEHEEISRAEMEALRMRGELAWEWEAHGHHYAVRSEYAMRVQDGGIVVVNGSREHARGLGRRPDLRCVLLTAPSHLLRRRLQERGREGGHALSLRLARNAQLPAPFADRVIANDTTLAAAGQALRDYLLELAR